MWRTIWSRESWKGGWSLGLDGGDIRLFGGRRQMGGWEKRICWRAAEEPLFLRPAIDCLRYAAIHGCWFGHAQPKQVTLSYLLRQGCLSSLIWTHQPQLQSPIYPCPVVRPVNNNQKPRRPFFDVFPSWSTCFLPPTCFPRHRLFYPLAC